MAQRNDFNFGIRRDINASDDTHETLDIRRAIRNQQAIAAAVCHHAGLLRHQRLQQGGHLLRGDMFEVDHAGHQRVAAAIRTSHAAVLRGTDVGHDLGHASGLHRGKAMHAQHGQEHLIDFVGIHRLGRHYGNVAGDARVDDETPPGDLADRFDQDVDFSTLEIERVSTRIRCGGFQSPRRWHHDLWRRLCACRECREQQAQREEFQRTLHKETFAAR